MKLLKLWFKFDQSLVGEKYNVELDALEYSNNLIDQVSECFKNREHFPSFFKFKVKSFYITVLQDFDELDDFSYIGFSYNGELLIDQVSKILDNVMLNKKENKLRRKFLKIHFLPTFEPSSSSSSEVHATIKVAGQDMRKYLFNNSQLNF